MKAINLHCITLGFHSTGKIRIKQFSAKSFHFVLARTVLFTVLLFNLSVFAQGNETDSTGRNSDTVRPDMFTQLKQMGKEQAAKSAIKYQEERIAYKQSVLLAEIKQTIQKAKAYLKRGIDTTGIKLELTNIQNWLTIAGDGIFTNKAAVQTHRNLTTSSKLIIELLKKAGIQKARIDKYENDLVNFRMRLDSLTTDSSLYTFSSDTAVFNSYFQKLIVASMEIDQPDTSLKIALKNVQNLQSLAEIDLTIIASDIEELSNLQKRLSDSLFKTEFEGVDLRKTFDRPFLDITKFSISKGKLTLIFYAQNNLGKIFFLVVLIIVLTVFLNGIKGKLKQDFSIQADAGGQLILRNTFLSSIIIVLNLFQFIFIDPPFVFNIIFWTTASISLTILFRNYIKKFWMYIWLVFLLLFLLASADNLILEASVPERLGILALSILGVIAGILVLLSSSKIELKEKWVLYFIGLVVVLEGASIFANFYGRYNLSKSLMTTGYFNVIIGLLFLWTIRLINNGLSLASQAYSSQGKKLFYINFEKVGKKVPTLFYVLVIIGWFILFGRNFYSFTLISGPVINFFLDERTIGNYSFTISNILVFFFIMAVSVISSKVVSFFTSNHQSGAGEAGKNKKAGVGSWLLLIRILIISMGLFLAFAAAGIPMDRITIIIGALGVGIGLGLQALVNNLVSGLIIAFEKPVNVGDLVEISGQAGTMKSIGFRSSVISTLDGADMVIPNGDLLNAHLINWTLSGGMRRGEILVGVSYKTDLERTKALLDELFQADARILKYPAPLVIVNQFGSSSIDLRILFWVGHYNQWAITRSDLITAIDIAFKKNDIEIPFAQQDIYIREMPGFKKDWYSSGDVVD